MTTRTALLHHPSSVLHQISVGHPERRERIAAIEESLKRHGLSEQLIRQQARAVDREELIQVHTPQYVDWIFENAPSEAASHLQIDGDTAMNEHSLLAAQTAAGAVLDAVDGIMEDQFDNAFCLIRPPGHHAERAKCMGFCFFDNVAVGAQYAIDKYQFERIAIVDFDVHHGNGTEDIFLDERRVLFCSTFQERIFPGYAANYDPGHIVNVPLPAYTDGIAYRKIFSETVLPELDAFKPQMIFFSAGFDAHKLDPLANLNLESEDFGWITEQVLQIANSHCDGRVVSTLEGGYDLIGLAEGASAHIQALINA